jgi:hypothetical protein
MVVSRSLWLPVGAANFYSIMTDPPLVQFSRDDGGLMRSCRADRADQPGYIPHLRESVLRRLVEVLPLSFGYDPVGVCWFDAGQERGPRPSSVAMRLRPHTATVGLPAAVPVNQGLIDAGVDQVTLRVDEHGFYTFTASASATGSDVEGVVGNALIEHMVQLFGGGFTVNRLRPSPERRQGEGAEAVRLYNGLRREAPDPGQPERPEGPPLGALSFYQLNVMMESLCNQSLLPSVFFEHYQRAEQWLASHRRRTSVVTNLDDYIREVTVDADATAIDGQILTLSRFLLVSRGSLQWMRRSVESVRRSLLDQMMAVSHRQARLIQLDLGGVEYERTPEMTGEASESQMRGYVMLMATKLPLIAVIADAVRASGDALARRLAGAVPDTADPRGDRLTGQIDTWIDLLDGLRTNVASLETAVEHDWQERLLYEQEQARSEQEAMAEIERSRRGRPETRRAGDAAYNAIMLVLTAVAVFIAIQTANTATTTERWQQVLNLWPLLVLGVAVLAAWPVTISLRRLIEQRKPDSELYSFEFAFRLDARVDAGLLHTYLNTIKPVMVRRAGKSPTIKIRRLGGWRWERTAHDTTLLKIHSIAVVEVGFLRRARFEIVTEIMTRRISNADQMFLRQCRMFGDTPKPLPTDVINAIVKRLIEHSCQQVSKDPDVQFELTGLTDPAIPHQRRSQDSDRALPRG